VVDLTKLGYALAIAEQGSYGAAAEKLGISQPALTRSIQGLEGEYGVRLFERGRGGAKLTAAGVEFMSLAQNLMHRAASVDQQMRSVQSGRSAPVSFGMGPISAATVLPALLPNLAAEGIQLRVRVESLANLQLLLRHGEIEFYVSGLPTGDRLAPASSDFRIKRIPLAALNLLVRPDHPLLLQEVRADDIRRYPIASGAFLRELFSPARLARFGLQGPSIEADDYTLLASLVLNSDFILVATQGLIGARPELGLVSLPISLAVDDVEWGLISSGRDALSSLARRVALTVLEALAKAVRPG
jgi:DNA-binding transcriptional LysR family regulator